MFFKFSSALTVSFRGAQSSFTSSLTSRRSRIQHLLSGKLFFRGIWLELVARVFSLEARVAFWLQKWFLALFYRRLRAFRRCYERTESDHLLLFVLESQSILCLQQDTYKLFMQFESFSFELVFIQIRDFVSVKVKFLLQIINLIFDISNCWF